MKLRWIVIQFLSIFKVKFYWVIKEICDTVKIKYKVIIDRWLVYKIKRIVYSMLYGFMKDYCCKLWRYFEELKMLNGLSMFEFVINFNISRSFSVF